MLPFIMLTDELMLTIAINVARWFELAGIAVVVLGTLVALSQFGLRYTGLRATPDGGRSGLLASFRRTLGRSILTGLELLVAADIIRTVAVEPTLSNVLILAIIVLIRTFLSLSLEVEIEGKWPWKQGDGRE
jgi:uncharacterized membrane protein